MPVTIRPATHPPRRWSPPQAFDTSSSSASESFFQSACPKEHSQSQRLIKSSFFPPFPSPSSPATKTVKITPNPNGLIHTCFASYSSHHHLSLRPQDIWFGILSQFSFYVNAHSEELRHKFVSHQGKKEILVSGGGTLFSADYGELTGKIVGEMGKYLVGDDDEGGKGKEGWKDWIYPDDLSGTTENDRVVAGILMMGTMQKYFDFKMMLVCGIPSVTLLGEREDWVKLMGRLDRLEGKEKGGYGEEVQDWIRLLRVVLGYFVKSFDDPEDEKVLDFWSRIAHKESGGSGPTWLSGWLTAFAFWNADGECMYQKPRKGEDGESGEWPDAREQPFSTRAAGATIDGVVFHRVDTEEIPVGYISVPVTVDDNGKEHRTKMVAGSMGIQGWSSGEFLDEPEPSKNGFVTMGRSREPDTSRQVTGLDSIQPLSGWMMYELKHE